LERAYLVEFVEPKYGHIPFVHDKLYDTFKKYAQSKSIELEDDREYDGPSWSWVADTPVEVSSRGRSVFNNNSGNRSAIGTKTLSAIAPRAWSVKVDKLDPGGWVGLGVAPSNARTLSFSGSEQMWMFSANSYSWPAQRMEGFAFAQGDIITIHYDGVGKLTYRKNGQDTGKFLNGFDAKNVYPVATVQRAKVTLLDKVVLG